MFNFNLLKTMSNQPDGNDAIRTMTDSELMEYFLSRIFETEEIWGLKDGRDWFTRQLEGRETLPVWPDKRRAEASAFNEAGKFSVRADSLEFFVYRTLNELSMLEVMVEVMPRQAEAGCLIDPRRLFNILEGMLEASQYSPMGD